MKSSPHRCDPASAAAFSLIELLTVVAIISLMTTLLVPAFNNLGKAQLLNSEGNRVVNLINLAGQNSASKNAMTALVALPGDSTRPGAYNTFGLFEYVPDASGWRQVSKWETLKDGIVVDQALSFTDYPTKKPEPDFPSITYRGATVAAYKYIVFLPNRSLLQNISAQVRLAEGFYAASASTPTYTRPGPGGPVNYYLVTVLGTTGRPKIDRP
ncbi:hypothetical protein BH09VER1_BH09VER1_27470 [soil metagenome]